MKKKNSIIQNSIIVTSQGIWNLSCINKTLETKQDIEKAGDVIDYYLKKMYHQTQKGKVYHENIRDTIDRLQNKLNRHLLFVRFDEWSDIKDDYVINK